VRNSPVTASAYWRGWPEERAALRTSGAFVLGMALAGVPAGLLWWALAPRADYRITSAGPEVLGSPSEELLVADDVVFLLVLAVTGLVLGAAAWLLRRRRGVATVVAIGLGAVATGAVAWQVGELLGRGPTEAELTEIGATVTTSLSLGSLAALAIAPFTALLVYVAAVLYAPRDDLGRTDAVAAAGAFEPPAAPEDDLPWQRPLVDVPPPGRP